MSTSATLTAPGSAARTRIPTACCASTFQRELISACMMPMSLRPSRSPSMRDPERPLAGKRPPRLWTNSSEPSIQGSRQRVLRRPLESAQYVSIKYTERLTGAGVEPSVGSVGDSYDNALAESINGLYKTEVIRRRGPWRSLELVEFATLEWVEWFNNRRLRGPIGNVPPAEAKVHYYAELETLPMAA